MTPFGRPPFDVSSGRIEVRRALTMGDRVYAPGEMMEPEDRATLTDRQLATLWQLGQIDTLSVDDEAELERLTAPAVQKAPTKPQPAARR